MNCPSCGAPLRLEDDKDFLACDYCRNICFPEKNEDGVRLLGEAAGLACPVCSVPLEHAALGGMRIFYCGRCRGLLVPMHTFVALLQDLRARQGGSCEIPHAVDRKGLERSLACPRCHARMDTHFYAGPGNVIIDDCSRCRLNWLDHGELMRIVRAPDGSPHEPGEPWATP
jgi:Zn-finger nucleic acid-binding protein